MIEIGMHFPQLEDDEGMDSNYFSEGSLIKKELQNVEEELVSYTDSKI